MPKACNSNARQQVHIFFAVAVPKPAALATDNRDRVTGIGFEQQLLFLLANLVKFLTHDAYAPLFNRTSVTKPAGSPICFAKHGHRGEVWPKTRLKDKLGDAFALTYRIGLRAGIQQENDEFPTVVRINYANALSHGNAFYRPKSAAGIDKSGNSRDKRLNSNASGNRSSFSRWNHKRVSLRETGAQIDPHRAFGGGREAIRAVKISGISEKKDIHSCLMKRNTCHEDAPVKEYRKQKKVVSPPQQEAAGKKEASGGTPGLHRAAPLFWNGEPRVCVLAVCRAVANKARCLS